MPFPCDWLLNYSRCGPFDLISITDWIWMTRAVSWERGANVNTLIFNIIYILWLKFHHYTILCPSAFCLSLFSPSCLSVHLSAMKNHHHFSSPAEEKSALIYNFSPVFTDLKYLFVQNYYFWLTGGQGRGLKQAQSSQEFAIWSNMLGRGFKTELDGVVAFRQDSDESNNRKQNKKTKQNVMFRNL